MDIGWSREVPWARRLQSAALLAAARSPRRSFDAVVVGEYERGFTARQFLEVADQLGQHGMLVWLPEADGPVDPGDPTHRALVTLLGAHAKREFVRARHRTFAAMRAQTVEQGRLLGGRPPYGYRLVDAGPHPNPADAAWGRRRRRLDPDPSTAPHVRWMFEHRLAGGSLAGIARELNDRGVACPSRDDSRRHGDRASGMWTAPTVGAILSNPRYTGRETWSRRQAVGRRGRTTVPGEAAVSKVVSHPALVTESDFVAAQRIRAARAGGDGRRDGMCCAGWCGAGTAVDGWMRTGCTGEPLTAVGMVIAAPARDRRTRRRTPTYARTRCSTDSARRSKRSDAQPLPSHPAPSPSSCARKIW